MDSGRLVELDTFIDVATAYIKQAEEFKEELKNDNPWLIKRGEKYNYTNSSGSVYVDSNDGLEVDKGRNSSGVVFKTKEEAEAHKRHEEIGTKIRKFARDYNEGWVAIWNKGWTPKYSLYYTHYNEEAEMTEWHTSQHPGVEFKDGEAMDGLREIVSAEELKEYLTYKQPYYELEE